MITRSQDPEPDLKFLVGQTCSSVPETQLPLAKDVLAFLLHRRGKFENERKGKKVSILEVISCVLKTGGLGETNCNEDCVKSGNFCCVYEVKRIWLKSGIPIIGDKSIREKIMKLYDLYQKVKKSST